MLKDIKKEYAIPANDNCEECRMWYNIEMNQIPCTRDASYPIVSEKSSQITITTNEIGTRDGEPFIDSITYPDWETV